MAKFLLDKSSPDSGWKNSRHLIHRLMIGQKGREKYVETTGKSYVCLSKSSRKVSEKCETAREKFYRGNAHEKTARITALCNQKGGVGKTVTAVNLGIGLAREGKRVRLVDVDPQGSLTASLGYQRPDLMENTLAEILGRIVSDEPQTPGEGIIQQAEGVDLLPANIELSGLEVTLVNTMSRETILREYLNGVRDRYDVILLDCCPSLGMLTINALAAADEVIIPAQAHYLSLCGMEQLIRTISNVKRKINPGPEIAGIPITIADMRTNYSRKIIDLLCSTYGSELRIFDSFIPLSIIVAETSAKGQSIYLHDPTGKVSAT